MAVVSAGPSAARPRDAYSRPAGPLAAFFAAFFVWTWLVVDPSLLYECTTYFPAFLQGREFAADFLWYPGGPVKYLAALLYQGYYYAWLGALLTTVLAAALYAGTRVVATALRGREVPDLAALLPALLVLAGAGQYGCHLAALLALSLALLCAAGYLAARERGLSPQWGAVLYGAACAALYYALAGPLLIFVLLCALYEGRRGGGRLQAALYLLPALLFPALLGVYWLDVPWGPAWFALLPCGNWGDPSAFDALGQWPLRLLCACLALLPCGLALWPVRVGAVSSSRVPGRPLVAWVLPVALLVLVGGTTLSGRVRHCLCAERCFVRGDWPGVLREAACVPGPDVVMPLSHEVNAALANQGRLLDDLFAYPQYPDSLLVGTASSAEAQWKLTNMQHLAFYPQLGAQDLELGLVNDAERQAHEALEVWGPHPVVLRRLAEINCLQGRPAAARRLLNALGGDLIWGASARRTAAEFGRGLPHSMRQSTRRLQAVRRRDDTYMGKDFDLHCRALLAANPRNRLAVQYLLAYHLLRREPWACAEDLGLLREAGYGALPRHLQEAMVLFEAQSGTRPNLQGYAIPDGARARFAAFTSLMDTLQSESAVERLKRQAAPEYGDTYYYYYAFEESGVGRR